MLRTDFVERWLCLGNISLRENENKLGFSLLVLEHSLEKKIRLEWSTITWFQDVNQEKKNQDMGKEFYTHLGFNILNLLRT
jgi:hypothetical protein